MEVVSKACPDKLIEKLDFLADYIESPAGKYYGSIAMKNLATKYADKVYTKKSSIDDLCGDASMGY